MLCKNKYQYQRFEDHFKEYQYEVQKAVDSKKKDLARSSQRPSHAKTPSFEELKNWLYNKHQDQDESTKAAFSDIEVLTKKEFAEMDQEEISLVTALLQKLADRVLRKKSRLTVKAKRAGNVDLRRTIQHSLRRGLEINTVIYNQPKTKRLKLVLLCDVSRSMDLYSRFFIQMIYAFQKGYDRISTFVFSTALHSVTDILTNHEFDKAYELIGDRVPEWSGGTRIGQCLSEFKANYGYSLLDRRTVVMILSDGWDTGESGDIRDAMKFIHKEARKVIWLNPLAGHPDFEPEVIGLKSVLPYIDKHVPAHNLESLKRVMYMI